MLHEPSTRANGSELPRGVLQIVLGQRDVESNDQTQGPGDVRRPLEYDASGDAQPEVGEVASVGDVEHPTCSLLGDAHALAAPHRVFRGALLVLLHHVTVGALVARVGAVGEARLAAFVAVETLVRSFSVDAELIGPVTLARLH